MRRIEIFPVACGQEVVVVPTGNNRYHSNDAVRAAVVAKVGRQYFYINYFNRLVKVNRFDFSTPDEAKNNAGFLIFESLDSYYRSTAGKPTVLTVG